MHVTNEDRGAPHHALGPKMQTLGGGGGGGGLQALHTQNLVGQADCCWHGNGAGRAQGVTSPHPKDPEGHLPSLRTRHSTHTSTEEDEDEVKEDESQETDEEG